MNVSRLDEPASSQYLPHYASVAEALPAAAVNEPDHGVLIVGADGHGSLLRYPELLDRSRALLAGLSDRGCGPGRTVVLYGLEPADFFPAFWACLLGGIVPLPIADRHAASAIEQLRVAGSALDEPVVLTDAAGIADLGHGTEAAGLSIWDIAGCRTAGPDVPVPAATPSGARVALQLFSSGSTGTPKLVPLTHSALLDFVAGSRQALGWDRDDSTLNWLPIDGSAALLLFHLLPVCTGALNIHVPTEQVLARPTLWFDLVSTFEVSHTWAPTFGFQLVAAALCGTEARDWDLSGVRSLISGGEQITTRVVDSFLATTAPYGLPPDCFVPAWGMTETVTGICWGNYGGPGSRIRVRTDSIAGRIVLAGTDVPDEECTTFVSVGRPAPGASVRVVDTGHRVVPVGTVGRLQVQSIRNTPGYRGDDEANARLFAGAEDDTWLDTGDLAFILDGQVVVVGRDKDIVIINGTKHPCRAIEEVVASVPGVAAGMCAACGTPDEATGSESLALFFVPTADRPAEHTAQEVGRAVLRRLRLLPKHVIPLAATDFPRTTGGKIRRDALVRLVERRPSRARDSDRMPSPDGSETLRELLRREITAVTGSAVDEYGADDKTPFGELGLTSVTVVQLHQRIGVEVPVAAFFEHPSIAELAGFLHTTTSEPAARSVVCRPEHGAGPVAVIGIGLRFPGAASPGEYWENLRTGRDLLTRGGATGSAPGIVPGGGVLDQVDGFDAEFFAITPDDAAHLRPSHRLFLECCYHALEAAGYAGDHGGSRIGVFAGDGANLTGYQWPGALSGMEDDLAGAMRVALGGTQDFLASRVAYHLNLSGPAVGVQTACSTSLVSVHLAVQALHSGDADLVLAGAASVQLPQGEYRYHTESVLSPTGMCRPFDASADGTVIGNGVAAVLLKPLDAAVRDGDPVLAVITGTAVNNDGKRKIGFTAPSVAGQAEVVRTALRRAGVRAEDLSYVEAHGTGTPIGDPVEFSALSQALRADDGSTGFCAVGSVKGDVGHLDACAGMAGLIKAVLMLGHRELVPTRNLRSPNPQLQLADSPLVLATEHRPMPPAPGGGTTMRIGVNSLGVGGTNAFVVMEEAPEPARDREPVERAVVVPLSARTETALRELAGTLGDWLLSQPVPPADVAASMAARPTMRERAVVVGASAMDIAKRLKALSDEPGGNQTADHGGGGPIAFAYSGQGFGYRGMARELYATFPEFRAALDTCVEAHRSVAAGDLLDVLARDAPDRDPLPTAIAQSALFAFQLALTAQWRNWGIEPDVVFGHSLGELAALSAAGGLSVMDGIRLTAERGRLMESAMHTGGMLAVRADIQLLERVAGETGLEVAVHNGMSDFVLAGDPAAVRRGAAVLDRLGASWRHLDVDRAFHSAMLDPILEPLAAAARDCVFTPLTRPLVSTLDGSVLPVGAVVDAGHVVHQARHAVRFDLAVAALHTTECRTVMEIGPRDELAVLGRRALPELRWTSTQRRSAGQVEAALRAVGELYRGGHRPAFEHLTPGGRRLPLPGYPFQRRTYPWPPAAVEVPSRRADIEPDLLDVVRRMTAERFGADVDDVDSDATFIAQGGDSLSLVGLTQAVERDFGVRVPVRVLFEEADSPRKLAAKIAVERTPDLVSSAPRPPVPVPVPVPVPTQDRTQPPAPAVTELLTAQLRLLDDMVSKTTGVMERQLAALSGANDSPIEPAGPDSNGPAAEPATSGASAPPRREQRVRPLPGREPGDTTCDYSLYLFGDYPDQDAGDKYTHLIQAAEFADANGFHAVWLPERHFGSFGGIFPNPSVLAAAMATRTSRIRLHAGSVVLPLHDPIRVAEEWSVVDNLSGGRAGLCVASGWHANDFALAPANYERRHDLMYERLDTVKKLWAGQPIPAMSGTGAEIDVRLFPRPVQAAPPLYTAVVGSQDSYRRAAENDLGIVTNLMAQSVDELAANIALYRRTRVEHGLDPAAGRVVVLMHTYLGDDEEHAREEAAAPFRAYLRSSLALLGSFMDSMGLGTDLKATRPDDLDFILDRAYRGYCAERAIIGSPDSCRSVVDAVVAAGADEIACFADFGVPGDRMLAGLPLITRLRATTAPAPVEAAPVEAAGTATPAGPATPAQRGLWLVDRMYPDRRAYYEPKGILLDGPLDKAALRGALNRVVARHSQLRSVFQETGGELRRFTMPMATVPCPQVDLTGLSARDALTRLVASEHDSVLDPATGPLFVAKLARLAEQAHLLFLLPHHMIFDSMSTRIFARDLAAFYRAWPQLPTDRPPLPEREPGLPAGQDSENNLRFWVEELTGAPVLELPADRLAAGEPVDHDASVVHDFGADLRDTVVRVAREHGVTPFMVLLSALGAVLGRLSGQDDFTLGTAVSSRPPGAEDRIGMFIDTVVLRMDLSGDPGFDVLVRRIRERSGRAYEHQGMPFDEIVRAVNPERVAGTNPLFTVMVEYENHAELDVDLPDLSVELLDATNDRAAFDLTCYLTAYSDNLRCTIEYDAKKFAERTVRQVLTYLEQVLLRVKRSGSATALSGLTAVIESDERQLASWQGGSMLTQGGCLHQLVERQAEHTPDAPAVVGDSGTLTYRELETAANRLAHALLAAGAAGPGTVVGIAMSRSADLITALLGVLKTGAAYLPLDVTLPEQRMEFCLTDSDAVALLADAEFAGKHPSVAKRWETHVVGAEPAELPGTAPEVPVSTDDLAYLIYTSGSTGPPKAVRVPHRGPVNLIEWQLRTSPPLRTLQWTSIGFDVSVQEVFGALASGAALVVVDEDTRRDPAVLAEAINRHGVQRLHMAYTALKAFVEHRPRVAPLREICVAGEQLVPTSSLAELLRTHPEIRMLNQYGPTETSVIVTCYDARRLEEPHIPIGRPIDNVTVHVLDPVGRPVPIGAVGELHVAGPAVTAGYHGDPERTAECFVDGPSGRAYRTGDLVRWRGDGQLEFLGRLDHQVKIRGHRVELAEVQWAIGQLPGVRDNAVVVSADDDEPHLVAYVVPDPGGSASPRARVSAWQEMLRAAVPAHLVPQEWLCVDRLPTDSNGKLLVDRLPRPESAGLESGIEPETATEKSLHQIWCKELNRDAVPLDTSFFNVGGDSLKVVRVLARMRDQFGIQYPLADFMRAPTIRAVARNLTRQRTA